MSPLSLNLTQRERMERIEKLDALYMSSRRHTRNLETLRVALWIVAAAGALVWALSYFFGASK